MWLLRTELINLLFSLSVLLAGATDVEKCGGMDWLFDPEGDQCYLVNSSQPLSWFEARQQCQLVGGELTSIESSQEQAFLHSTLRHFASVASVWTAGYAFNNFPYFQDSSNITCWGWEWMDETPFNFLNWKEGEPSNPSDESCLALDASTGLWNDVNCQKSKNFICEKKGNTTSSGNGLTDCKSNEACCFRHLGVEYGGGLSDDVLTASSQRSGSYAASRGRLNTPANVDVINGGSSDNGQGAWEPDEDDTEPWLQVDFAMPTEIKGVITQGRNGLIQHTERQWTTSYKISYSQESNEKTGLNVSEWEWLSDSDGKAITFDGNSDQDTQLTNLFPRPIVARHVRCHPVTWKERAALRLEYIGCQASCLFKLGMNSGIIPDKMITASSIQNGSSPQHARPPVDNEECLASFSSNKGADYRGWISKTESQRTCQRWDTQSPHSHSETSNSYPNAGLDSNFCRNPNGRKGPWCYTTDTSTEWEYCSIPTCPTYAPSGWSPASANQNEFIQVQFDDFYKVSGVTIYKQSASYVTSYALWFSDDGTSFKIYTSQDGSDHMFAGVDANTNEFMDILREPISTKFVRIQPRTWSGSIVMQFEINGCYVDNRITCQDDSTMFQEGSATIACPSGCVEDPNRGTVYGTKVYTENSAICPAAIHAGRVTNNHGGQVNVIKTSGKIFYQGSFANEIQSFDASSSATSMEFDGSTYRCEDGWKAWKDHCYFLSHKDVKKSWQDARDDCQSMGADLASVTSMAENNFIETVTKRPYVGGEIWLGLNDLTTQNYYQWSDGSQVMMTLWWMGEPNGGELERCVNFYRKKAMWSDRDCKTAMAYLCKKEKQLLPPAIPAKPTTNHPSTKPTVPTTVQPPIEPTKPTTDHLSTEPITITTNHLSTEPITPITDHPSMKTTKPAANLSSVGTTKPTTNHPSMKPTESTTNHPSTKPTEPTTNHPSTKPTKPTTNYPSTKPTEPTTNHPSTKPTTNHPSTKPTEPTTDQPPIKPTKPTTDHPSTEPIKLTTNNLSTKPITPITNQPSMEPTKPKTEYPSEKTTEPVTNPPPHATTNHPSEEPTKPTTNHVSTEPTQTASNHPSLETTKPTTHRSSAETAEPSTRYISTASTESTTQNNSTESMETTSISFYTETTDNKINSDGGGKGFGIGEIAGIVIGAVAVLMLIGGGAFICISSRGISKLSSITVFNSTTFGSKSGGFDNPVFIDDKTNDFT